MIIFDFIINKNILSIQQFQINKPMREAMSNAVHPFLACIVTSAPFSIRYIATGLFLETKDYNK